MSIFSSDITLNFGVCDKAEPLALLRLNVGGGSFSWS